MENINYSPEELMPIVAELATKYCGYGHSSITYERGQMLMEAVLYCINEYENPDNNTLLVNNIPAKDAYIAGQKIVIKKAKELQELYNDLIVDFQDYGLECLKYTIVKGIPRFLLKYDTKYAPQETLLALDYPILKNLGTASGINAVLEYVKCIYFEQQFLKRLDSLYVIEILTSYHKNYGTLLENICTIVLQNIIGHIILDKPLYSIGFSKKEYEGMENILLKKTDREIESYIADMLNFMIQNYYENNILLLDYLANDIPNIATRIKYNLENHCLDKIFLI